MDATPSAAIEILAHEIERFPQNTGSEHDDRLKAYQAEVEQSLADPNAYWLNQANRIEWMRPPTQSLTYEWNTEKRIISHTCYADGILNATTSCLDRHANGERSEKTAIIWQGEESADVRRYTYTELRDEVCRCANVLKRLGAKKGDRIAIYLPLIPEAIIAMLACARIGAIHTVVFGGFSAESLRDRINNAEARILITANAGRRNGKVIPLKTWADEALRDAPTIAHVVVVRSTSDAVPMTSPRDHWYSDLTSNESTICEPEPMNAEDPLFILYTSGSTGKPKGVLHTTGGYLVQAALSHERVFGMREDDVYWCTADVGWITGHTYVVYGPLANGSTVLLYEGGPTYPNPGRTWDICDTHRVTVFYTAPTLIRLLMSHGDEWPSTFNLSTLRMLGCVGEPINPEAWRWYFDIIGKKRCPIMDTWWQTETGSILISPLAGIHDLKPGSALRPFFGIEAAILKPDGSVCGTKEGGALCLTRPWPGITRTLWGDHEKFIDTYFTANPNVYTAGDGCYRDEDGDLWILGRLDDVVNVAGHRIGTAEVESALVNHDTVAEAAIVPIRDPIKGQALAAFVTLMDGVTATPDLKQQLLLHVRTSIGPIAVPASLTFAPALPKTRSGKIMRRILRAIAEGNTNDLGDVSTLADPGVVDTLLRLKEPRNS